MREHDQQLRPCLRLKIMGWKITVSHHSLFAPAPSPGIMRAS